MELKVGDVVEFKKYEDMTEDERMMIDKDHFPLSGKVKEINDRCFFIIGSKLFFSKGSVARVFSHEDDVDISSLNKGDEVLVKVTVKKVFDGFIQIEPSIDKTDVVNILKHEEPDCFIVKEDRYDLYIGATRDLVSSKDRAKIYGSRDDANVDAADMQLNAWEVIPYDD